MRSKSRTMLAALVAVLALGALASASASAALPELGPYHAGEKLTFTINEMRFQNKGGNIWGCSGGTGEGEITGAKTIKAKLKFSGCVSSLLGKCGSKGAKSEEIVTISMPVELVYLNKEKHETALVFNYNNGKTPFAEYECTNQLRNEWTQSVIVPIAAKTLSKTFKLKFAHREISGGEWEQLPSQYENEAGKLVTAYPLITFFGGFTEPASMTGLVEMSSEKQFEVKA